MYQRQRPETDVNLIRFVLSLDLQVSSRELLYPSEKSLPQETPILLWFQSKCYKAWNTGGD